MNLMLSLAAAFGCAILNGIAVILEKTGVDQIPLTNSSFNIIWHLKNNYLYILGIILDLIAWLLTIYAVFRLPLFIVQPIIALSIIITVILENLIFKKTITSKMLISFLVIIVGLILLAMVAKTQTVPPINSNIKWSIVLFPIVLIIAGIISLKISNKNVLAVLSGLSFGGVSIAGRVLGVHGINLYILENPIIWAIIVYGLVGIYFFTLALKKNSASLVNAIMIGAETMFPIIIGVLILGDRPLNNNWYLAISGSFLIILGTILMNLEFQFTKIS